MERTYGNKYQAQLTTKEIAQRVREDIARERAHGRLPRGKYSVRMKRFAGGSSIDVRISDLEVSRVFSDLYLAGGSSALMDAPCEVKDDGSIYRPGRNSEEVQEVLAKVEVILQAYNHDGSDTQSDYFDVNFYGHAELDWEWANAREAAEKATLQEAR